MKRALPLILFVAYMLIILGPSIIVADAPNNTQEVKQ